MDRRDFLKFLAWGGTGAALLKGDFAFAGLDMDLQGEANADNTINTLFDSWSSQVMFQRKPYRYPYGVGHPQVTKKRLNTVLGAIKSYGLSTGVKWNVRYTNSRIRPESLENVDVYVSLTRYINQPNSPPVGTGFSYGDSELAALEDFVSQGGGILLMTDHGHGESDDVPDFTENDAALASVFGITLKNIFVTHRDPEHPDRPVYMVMEMNPDLPEDLKYIANQVSHVSAHDSCIMLPPAEFTPLVMFPDGATAYDHTLGHNIDLPNHYFSILVPYGQGKVIVVGNSGTVGDYGSPNPAPGLISIENNLMFFLNCVTFLAGHSCIPDPDQGPCDLFNL